MFDNFRYSTISHWHGVITQVSAIGATNKDLSFRWKQVSSQPLEGAFLSSCNSNLQAYSIYHDATLTDALALNYTNRFQRPALCNI